MKIKWFRYCNLYYFDIFNSLVIGKIGDVSLNYIEKDIFMNMFLYVLYDIC